MTPFLKSCWRHSWVRGTAWTLISLVTAWTLFCSWFSWRGARAWKLSALRLEQEHESLDFRKCAADPIPDETNFCAIPMLKDIAFSSEASAGKRQALDALSLPVAAKSGSPAEPGVPNGAAFGVPVDLKPWAERLRLDPRRAVPDSGNPAQDLLAMFAKDQPKFAELATGLDRKEAQWTPSWKTRELPENLFAAELPHYQTINHLLQVLCLRSIAASRAGDSATARDSLRIALRMNQATLQEPFLIGLLVAASNTGRIASAIWELCAAPAGTAPDFAALQQELETVDFQQSALRAYRSELAAAAGAVLWLERKRDPQVFAMIDGNGGAPSNWLSHLLAGTLPSGFFMSNAASIVNIELEHLILPLRDEGLAVTLREAAAVESQLAERRQHWLGRFDDLLASVMLPAVSQCTQSAAYAQCLAHQALTACALERHRLERGAYPDELSQVRQSDGRALPPDLHSGKAMGYRKTADGRYLLWSTGPDAKDDGGKRNLDPQNPAKTKFRDPNYQGDWVWDFHGTPGAAP